VIFSSKDVPGLVPDLLVIHEKVLGRQPAIADDVKFISLDFLRAALTLGATQKVYFGK
jgi:hypothetical protein